MALQDPVAVYNAANNMEAVFLRDVLKDAGIEAYATEDVSQVGTWIGGLVPEIHKPQVWVERDAVERAAAFIVDYEQRQKERRSAEAQTAPSDATIDVVCEECGQTTSFRSSLRGSVQQCAHCREYVDVGEPEDTPDSAVDG